MAKKRTKELHSEGGIVGTQKHTVNRRQFLQIVGGGSAALAASRFSYALPKLDGGDPQFAALYALPPGAVKPAGWLGLYIQKQAQGLALHLPDVSWPFTDAYWAGEENSQSWWPWEQLGYWIDGALRCGLLSGDQRLLAAAQTPINYTLSHAAANGYLGPAHLQNLQSENDAHSNRRWPHTVFFRALMAQGEASRDPQIAEALRKHYLNDSAPYGSPVRNVTNVEGMLWAYQRSGDPRLLAMAERAWVDFLTSAPPGDFESGDLTPERVFANTPIHAHGVTYVEKAKLPAILYTYTGKQDYLRFALAAQERIFNHHMLIDGIPSTTERYRDTTSLDAHETCDISDHIWSWGYLLMATGDGIWGDRIERACFNAGFGAIKKDWKAVQYFSCPNQVLATQDSNHTMERAGGTKILMAYQPNPGCRTACCGGNVHRFFPNYVIRMWMHDAEGGLAVALYGAGTVRAQVGAQRQFVEIIEETDYPFAEEIHFTIHSREPVTFPLSLRIPAWCSAPKLYLNDKPLLLPAMHRGFVVLRRKFDPRDKITLVLPMQTAVAYSIDSGIGFERGPLVYSMHIPEQWSPFVHEKCSTAEYPGWDARPAAPWNYGIDVSETELRSQIEFKQARMTSDPWVEPPVALTVPFKKIPSWTLRNDPVAPAHQLTPPLPDSFDDMANSPVEKIALVPYGSTHLRLTIFPISGGGVVD